MLLRLHSAQNLPFATIVAEPLEVFWLIALFVIQEMFMASLESSDIFQRFQHGIREKLPKSKIEFELI